MEHSLIKTNINHEVREIRIGAFRACTALGRPGVSPRQARAHSSTSSSVFGGPLEKTLRAWTLETCGEGTARVRSRFPENQRRHSREFPEKGAAARPGILPTLAGELLLDKLVDEVLQHAEGDHTGHTLLPARFGNDERRRR